MKRRKHFDEVTFTEFDFDNELHIEGPAKGAHGKVRAEIQQKDQRLTKCLQSVGELAPRPKMLATMKTTHGFVARHYYHGQQTLAYETRRNYSERTRCYPEKPATGPQRKIPEAGLQVSIGEVSLSHLYSSACSSFLTWLSTWRPLNAPVLEDNPLAFCDFTSVCLQDLVPCDRVYPVFVGEVYMIKHNPDQRWHWVSKQSPEEVTVMLMYDTHSDGKARRRFPKFPRFLN